MSSSPTSANGAHLAAGSKVLALGDNALVVVDVVLPAVLGLVLVGEAGVEACCAQASQHTVWSVAGSRLGWGRSVHVQAAAGALGSSYQLWSEVSLQSQKLCRRPGQHTSNELEGLRHHLVAILVVGHDCGWFGGVERGGVAAMAGGRRQVVSQDVRTAMG